MPQVQGKAFHGGGEVVVDWAGRASRATGSQDRRGLTVCPPLRPGQVKCDKSNPCARCVRLGLNCVEQVRGRGRPLVSYMLRPGAEGEGSGPAGLDLGQPSWYSSLAFGSPERSLPAIQEFVQDQERLARINRKKLLIVL
jgi:hypothetical protein